MAFSTTSWLNPLDYPPSGSQGRWAQAVMLTALPGAMPRLRSKEGAGEVNPDGVRKEGTPASDVRGAGLPRAAALRPLHGPTRPLAPHRRHCGASLSPPPPHTCPTCLRIIRSAGRRSPSIAYCMRGMFAISRHLVQWLPS